MEKWKEIVGACKARIGGDSLAWTGKTGGEHIARAERGVDFIGRWEYRPNGIEFVLTLEASFPDTAALEKAIEGWDEWCRVRAFDEADANANYDAAHDQWRAASDAGLI